MWQTNLLQNLLAVFVLLAVFMIIYCKYKNQTFMEVFKEVREGLADE